MAGRNICGTEVDEGNTVHFTYHGMVEMEIIGYVSKITDSHIRVGNQRWTGFPKKYIERCGNYRIDRIAGLTKINISNQFI